MAQSFRVFLLELKEGEGFDQVLGVIKILVRNSIDWAIPV